jgi:hypothetical protein
MGSTFAAELKKMNVGNLSDLDPSFHLPCPCKGRRMGRGIYYSFSFA